MKKKVFREKYYGKKDELKEQVEKMLEIEEVSIVEPKKKGRKKKND